MEKLLASSPQKKLKIIRGEKVEGEVLSKTQRELILEIGSKSEGVLPLRDLPQDQQESIKIGDKLSAFVVLPENESGQVSLAFKQQSGGSQKYKGVNWSKFQNALDKKGKLQGKVLEINKGGLIVEAEGSPREAGTRGFLPNSQVGFDLLSNLKQGLETLVGQTINVGVTEVNAENNRLIFSQRGQVSDHVLEKLRAFKGSQKVKGKVVAILPFGLVIDLDGVEGLVFISDVSWEKIENLESAYKDAKGIKVGQEVEAQVLGIDEDLGRVNLSIKHLTEDPFAKIAQNLKGDEVVKGELVEVTDAGIVVNLEGLTGFLPASKMDPNAKYDVGESMSFLVDSVDLNRRRINLAPFVTTTAGLIYK